MSYTDLIDIMVSDEAREARIVDDQTDVRLVAILYRIWQDSVLRHWLTGNNADSNNVKLKRWLPMIGWLQRHDCFADGVTKQYLASFLWTQLVADKVITPETVRSYMKSGSRQITPSALEKLKRIIGL